MRKALEWLGGSCLVYAALAACSGASNTATDDDPAGVAGMLSSSGQTSSGGAPVTSSAGKATATGGAGGLLDPVPPAMAAAGSGGASAAAPVPVTVTSACDKELKIGTNNQPVAIFDFPGETALSLMRAKAMLTFAGSDLSAAEGFTGRVQDFYVKEGQLAVWCTNASESVTVVL